MTAFVLQPTSTAQWYSLVCEAEAQSSRFLGEQLESYLVFLLMRFLEKPDIAQRVLAIEYLEALLAGGERQASALRDVGDICLLHAGLFPRRAKRRRVKADYFVNLGRGAYHQLAQRLESSRGEIYQLACEAFSDMTDVLHSIRRMRDGQLTAGDTTTAPVLYTGARTTH